MSNAVMNSVYNHYLTAYAPKSTTQFDTHKKSDLRKVYNSIVKLNKESPWYLDVDNKEKQSYAVNIKENARSLRHTIASLGGLDSDQAFAKKTAYSTDNDAVAATYVGQSNANSPAPTLEISVSALASPQENMGTFLPEGKVALPADTYSFELAINDLNYEFQFNIEENETNRDVQARLVRLINKADLGLKARLDEGEARSSIRLTSTYTGLPEGREEIFHISDTIHDKGKASVVDYFGLGYTSRQASNSTFTLNGEERSTASNTFTVGDYYEIELKGPTDPETPVTIGLKTDVESITDNINTLICGYNTFISGAENKLMRETGRIASLYEHEMNKMGIRMGTDHTLSIDEDVLTEMVSTQGSEFSYATLKDFAGALVRKTNQVSLNPMEYVDRTIAAYKNPGRSFANPYVTSSYSGMMFNSYC